MRSDHSAQGFIQLSLSGVTKLNSWMPSDVFVNKGKGIQSWLQLRLAPVLQKARGAKLRAVIEGGTDVTCVLELHCGSLSKKIYNFPVNFQMIFFNVLR